MAPHIWSHLGDTVSDATHHMCYRGQRIKEAYYRGECIWRENRPDNVCFWDWDGTLLAAYGREEFLVLTEMPSLHREWTPTMIDMSKYSSIPKYFENPNEILLTPDGYNWTLEEAQEFVQKFGYCDIGTIYYTPYTYLWIRIEGNNSFIRLIFHQIDDNIDEQTIDWGDGSPVENYHQDIRSNYYSEHDNGVNRNHPHLYKNAGIYLVKIQGKHTFGHVSAYMITGSLGLGISACVINSVTDIVYSFSFGNYVQQISFYDYNIVDWHEDWPERNVNMNAIGGAFNGNWRLNLLAAYVNGGSVLGEYAFASTNAIAIGLSNGTTLGTNTGEFYCTRMPHITFPKSITSLLYDAKKTKAKITSSQVEDEWNIPSSFGAGLWKPDNYSGDSTFIYAIFPPYGWQELTGDSESNYIFPTYLKTTPVSKI